MNTYTLRNLGTIVRKKRGNVGLRDAAADIGTSAPTLSRIESGKLPDLQTFAKLCRWLEIDPAMLLDTGPAKPTDAGPSVAFAHLRAGREIDPDTASALARAIVRAQRMLVEGSGDSDGERL